MNPVAQSVGGVPGWGPHAAAWKRALATLGCAWIVAALLYRDSLASMVHLWWSAETYTHCAVIAPIVLWLAWRRRAELLSLSPAIDARFVGALLAAGAVWLAGALGEVNALAHLGLVAIFVALVPALLGAPSARLLAFPLAFAFFAVPVGDFLLPVMMEWTADFAVAAIRLTGIPIYREGLNFIIPSGAWSVVEACSGVRYLIASVTVGTLFAYLTYQSLARRLAFVGVSIVVPIVANWLRAYMIVMLGHLSGNTIAVGVDHLVYGWLFFGVVIMIMFAIGSRFAEPESPAGVAAPVTAAAAEPTWRRAPAAALVAATVSAGPLVAHWLMAPSAVPVRLAALGAIPGWQAGAAAGDWRPVFAAPAGALVGGFERDARRVSLHVGFYRNQQSDRRLVSSANVLVASNDPVWLMAGRESREAPAGAGPAAVEQVALRTAGPAGQQGRRRLLVWRWYWVAGRSTSSEHVAKALTAWSRLTGRGDDGAVIVLWAEGDAEGAAGRDLADFARAAGPALDTLLAAAAGAR